MSGNPPEWPAISRFAQSHSEDGVRAGVPRIDINDSDAATSQEVVMEDGESWVGDFTELRRCLDRAAEASDRIAAWMRMRLDPERLPPDVLTLMEDISKAPVA